MLGWSSSISARPVCSGSREKQHRWHGFEGESTKRGLRDCETEIRDAKGKILCLVCRSGG